MAVGRKAMIKRASLFCNNIMECVITIVNNRLKSRQHSYICHSFQGIKSLTYNRGNFLDKLVKSLGVCHLPAEKLALATTDL